MRLYLDYNATAPIDSEVSNRIPEWLECFGNPSSVHADGRAAKVALENARSQIADNLNVSPMDVLFTSGGTEANNWALFQILKSHSVGNPAHLIVSKIEHSCVLNAAQFLEDQGVQVTRISPDVNGYISAQDIESAILPNTRLISIMAANNEVGTLQPVAEIAALADDRGIMFHSDAVQAFGKVPIDFTLKGLSLASISGHKIGALKGIGALIATESSNLRPWTFGGGHEYGKRSGTENWLGILSLGDVVSRLNLTQSAYSTIDLTDFRSKLQTEFPKLWLSADSGPVLPNTICLAHPGVKGRSLMMNLDLSGLSVSTGSACATGSIEPSHVLMAMGLDPWIIDGAIRMSVGPHVTPGTLEAAREKLSSCLRQLAAN